MVAEAVAVELYRDPGVRQTLTERLIRAGLPGVRAGAGVGGELPSVTVQAVFCRGAPRVRQERTLTYRAPVPKRPWRARGGSGGRPVHDS